MNTIAINGSPRKGGIMADLGQTMAWLGKAIHQSPDRLPCPVYSEPPP